AESGLRQEFVLIDDGGDGHLAIRRAIIQTDHSSLTSDPDAFGQRNLRRKSQRKLNRRAARNGRIHIEGNASGADIAGLRGFLLGSVVGIGHSDGQAQRKTSGRPLLLLGLSHENASESLFSMAWRPFAVKTTVRGEGLGSPELH